MPDSFFIQAFNFFKTAERLKSELRHSWTSNSNRQESVAEHIWMVSLMALIFADKVSPALDVLKAIKMAIIHDLGEAVAGDIPSHEVSARQDGKKMTEGAGFKQMVSKLEPKTSQEFTALWEEFEARKTQEAQFVYALDKFECLYQHDCADIKTWDEGDYRYTFIEKQDTPFDFDSFMRKLKDNLDNWTMSKMERAGTADKVPKENMDRYESRAKVNNSEAGRLLQSDGS